MKKSLALLLIVLGILTFMSPGTKAQAHHSWCPYGYKFGHSSVTYDIMGDTTTVAARVTISAETCYNSSTDLQERVYASAVVYHRNWRLDSIDKGVSMCTNGPDCVTYRYWPKFNRTYADGSPRSSICTGYGLDMNANGMHQNYVLMPKTQC
jgi:hypothetical protein